MRPKHRVVGTVVGMVVEKVGQVTILLRSCFRSCLSGPLNFLFSTTNGGGRSPTPTAGWCCPNRELTGTVGQAGLCKLLKAWRLQRIVG